MKVNLLLLVCLCFLSVQAFAQSSITVSGIITDGTGPLPGVNVLEKGTSHGAISDMDGRYRITVPENATLEFTFTGMAAITEPVNSRTTIDIVMGEDATVLGDVVITALGIKKEKKALGYASQEVGSEEFSQARETNPINSLAGKVAGVNLSNASGNMGGSTKVLIRGVSSITGNNNPLYVVDGVPVDNTDVTDLYWKDQGLTNSSARGGGGADFGNMAQDFSADDIESISVLKGAAATALYGSRASGGVILITTKRGAKQRNKVGISVNSGVEFNKVNPNLSFINRLQNEYGGGQTSEFVTQEINGTEYSLVDYATDASWGPKFEGQQVLHYDAFYPGEGFLKTREWKPTPNDIDKFYELGVTFRNNVSFSGGSDGSTFRASYTNVNADGYFPNSLLKQNIVNLSGESKLSEKVTVRGVATYSNFVTQNRPVSGYDNKNPLRSATQWFQRQLDYERLKNYKVSETDEQIPWNRTAWDNPSPKYTDNPYWSANENYSNDERNKVYGNASLSYKFNEVFSATVRTGTDVYSFTVEDRISIGSFNQSKYEISIFNSQEYNHDFILNFNKTILDGKWDFGAHFGGNLLYKKLSLTGGATNGGLIVPLLYNLNNAGTVVPKDYKEQRAINSLFGDATVGYNGTLYLNVSARNDWSSTLPKGSNSYFYPAVSLSFIISEIDALQTLEWLTFAKLRGGIAQIGSDTDPYRLQQFYIVDPDGVFGTVPSFKPARGFNNENLNPEISTEFEIGLEAKFLEDRAGFEVTYYNRTTKDQIIPLTISGTTGYNTMVVNAGKVQNKGLELLVYGEPIKTKNFTWRVTLNAAMNVNEVLELIEGVDNYRLITSPFRVSLNATVGQEYGQIYGRDFIRDKDGNKVVGTNGEYLSSSIKPLGSYLPRWRGGLMNSFSYKGIDVSVLIDAQIGGKYYSTTNAFSAYSGLLDITAENGVRENGLVLDAKQVALDDQGNPIYNPTTGIAEVTGDNTAVIDAFDWAQGFYTGPDAQSIFDATYFKLREVTVGYTVKLPNPLGTLDAFKLSFYARNLAAWGLANKGMDPEISVSQGNFQGVEAGLLPSVRSFGFNLNFNF